MAHTWHGRTASMSRPGATAQHMLGTGHRLPASRPEAGLSHVGPADAPWHRQLLYSVSRPGATAQYMLGTGRRLLASRPGAGLAPREAHSCSMAQTAMNESAWCHSTRLGTGHKLLASRPGAGLAHMWGWPVLHGTDRFCMSAWCHSTSHAGHWAQTPSMQVGLEQGSPHIGLARAPWRRLLCMSRPGATAPG